MASKEEQPYRLQIKDVAAPASSMLGDILVSLNEESSLDRVRSALAFRMNQYNDIALNQSDIQRLQKAFRDIKAGSATNLVVICQEHKCIYKTRCPMFKHEHMPVGRECIYENYILTEYMDSYLKSLEVDPENMPEMSLVNQLVEYELIEYRCNVILSLDHTDLKMTQIIGLDKEGNIVEKEDLSYALTIKMNVQKMKQSILESFTATRKEKWKKQAALKEVKEGPIKMLSSLKARIQQQKENMVDAKEVSHALNNVLNDEY